MATKSQLAIQTAMVAALLAGDAVPISPQRDHALSAAGQRHVRKGKLWPVRFAAYWCDLGFCYGYGYYLRLAGWAGSTARVTQS